MMINTQTRLNKLIAKLNDLKADAVLISNLSNIFYLTGFTGSTAYLIITENKRIFVTDFRYHEQVSQQVSGFELFDNSAKGLDKVLTELKSSLNITKLAFEGAHLPFSSYNILNNHFKNENLLATSELVEELRMIKEPEEIEIIKKAVRINEIAFLEILDWIKLGATESDIAAEHEYRLRKHGAKSNSFDPIIASGVNSSKPHAGFTKSAIVFGAPLTIDIGCIVDQYCSDMTRTVFVGDCPKKWLEIYEIVLRAKEASAAGLSAGKTGVEIDKIARDIITESGHGDKFGHGLGHGVGINVHEQPRLSSQYEKILIAGSIVTVEPGIYLPGEGGIRIEDMYVVNTTGCTRLNTISAELTIVG